MTTQPSNSNLEGPGSIVVTPDFTRQAVKMEVHFTTVHLQPEELKSLLYRFFVVGKQVYGIDWSMETFAHIGTIPVERGEIAVPTPDQVIQMGEDHA